MNQSFYTSAAAAQQYMLALNIQGNNIANVNTIGFKGENSRFVSLFHERMESIEGGNESVGSGARLLMTSTDHSQGTLNPTGRTQDYAIRGAGYFAVVDLNTNEVTFTRNGAFEVTYYERYTGRDDENGIPIMETSNVLTDGEGRFVLGRNGNIIHVNDPNAMQNIGIFDYANYDGMQHLNGTEFLPIDKNGNLYYGTGELVQGALEGSNVELADAITKVIEAQRAYSMALRVVQTSDEIENTINNLR